MARDNDSIDNNTNARITRFPKLTNSNIHEIEISYNDIKSLDSIPSNIKNIIIHGNPIENISGIWRSNLKDIEFDQENLFDEINLYCKLTGCFYYFYETGEMGNFISSNDPTMYI